MVGGQHLHPSAVVVNTIAEEDTDVEQETARIRALPPWERALAVSALFDRAYVWVRLAARYRDDEVSS